MACMIWILCSSSLDLGSIPYLWDMFSLHWQPCLWCSLVLLCLQRLFAPNTKALGTHFYSSICVCWWGGDTASSLQPSKWDLSASLFSLQYSLMITRDTGPSNNSSRHSLLTVVMEQWCFSISQWLGQNVMSVCWRQSKICIIHMLLLLYYVLTFVSICGQLYIQDNFLTFHICRFSVSDSFILSLKLFEKIAMKWQIQTDDEW